MMKKKHPLCDPVLLAAENAAILARRSQQVEFKVGDKIGCSQNVRPTPEAEVIEVSHNKVVFTMLVPKGNQTIGQRHEFNPYDDHYWMTLHDRTASQTADPQD